VAAIFEVWTKQLPYAGGKPNLRQQAVAGTKHPLSFSANREDACSQPNTQLAPLPRLTLVDSHFPRIIVGRAYVEFMHRKTCIWYTGYTSPRQKAALLLWTCNGRPPRVQRLFGCDLVPIMPPAHVTQAISHPLSAWFSSLDSDGGVCLENAYAVTLRGPDCFHLGASWSRHIRPAVFFY
jgi:hypothetical protein